MKVLMSGASGFIGTELVAFLKTCGHKVIRLVRDKSQATEEAFFWDPAHGAIDEAAFEGINAVINLCGENVAGGRWSDARKQRILESRVQATSTLSKAMARLTTPPSVFISASAIGYYGDCGDVVCREDAGQGQGFLAKVCKEWEKAAEPAVKKGIRTVFLRTGIVLSPRGGALAKMLLPFKLGFGGAFGSGEQMMSWISIDDLAAIVLFIMMNPTMSGPVNAVAPNPVTNKEFTEILGQVLSKPTFFNTPAFALRFILGEEMANEFILSSTKAEPFKLTQEGYSFLYPDLKISLKHSLGV